MADIADISEELISNYIENIRPVLSQYFTPSESDLTKIATIICGNIGYVKRSVTPEDLIRRIERADKRHQEDIAKLQAITNNLNSLLANIHPWVIGDFNEKIENAGLSKEQFLESLNVLYEVAAIEICQPVEVRIKPGRPLSANSWFSVKLSRTLSSIEISETHPRHLNQNQKAKIIVRILSKLAGVIISKGAVIQILRDSEK